MLVQDVTSETALPNGHLPERDFAPAAHTSTPALFSLADSTIVVTGGGRGIGQALAKGIAEAGGSVACLDVLPEPTNGDGEWDAIKKAASKTGASASYHVCDITNEELMLETFNKIEKVSKGTVRGVVAGAGVQQMVPAIDYPMDGFRRIMEIKSVLLFSPWKDSEQTLFEDADLHAFVSQRRGRLRHRKDCGKILARPENGGMQSRHDCIHVGRDCKPGVDLLGV